MAPPGKIGLKQEEASLWSNVSYLSSVYFKSTVNLWQELTYYNFFIIPNDFMLLEGLHLSGTLK